MLPFFIPSPSLNQIHTALHQNEGLPLNLDGVTHFLVISDHENRRHHLSLSGKLYDQSSRFLYHARLEITLRDNQPLSCLFSSSLLS